MPGTAGPNLGLVSGYSAHESDWGLGSYNPGFAMLDAVTFLRVLAIQVTPPGAPSAGDRYIVGASATGAWVGQDNALAVYRDAAWVFYPPKAGWTAYNVATGKHIRFESSWADDISGSLTLFSELTDTTITTPAENDVPIYDISTAKWINRRQKYIVGAFTPGEMTDAQVLLLHRFSIGVTFPADFGPYLGLYFSQAGGTVNATGSTVMTISKAGSVTPNTFAAIGTITIAAGTVTPTPATVGGTAKTFAAGDVLKIEGPPTADATFADFYTTLVGYET